MSCLLSLIIILSMSYGCKDNKILAYLSLSYIPLCALIPCFIPGSLSGELLLTDIGSNNIGTLTATWIPLPSIPSGLESHYHYVIQLQTMTSSDWGDWQDVLTVVNVGDRDIYRETTDVTLELDVRYRVRLQAVREHQNLRERTTVSQVLRIQTVSAGK